jgi:hypothetical protein
MTEGSVRERGVCPECFQQVSIKRDGTLRKHGYAQPAYNGRVGDYCIGIFPKGDERMSEPTSRPKVAAPPRPTPSQALLRFFEADHLPENLKIVSVHFGAIARRMEEILPDGAEKTFCIRQLLIAKDAAVRAAL